MGFFGNTWQGIKKYGGKYAENMAFGALKDSIKFQEGQSRAGRLLEWISNGSELAAIAKKRTEATVGATRRAAEDLVAEGKMIVTPDMAKERGLLNIKNFMEETSAEYGRAKDKAFTRQVSVGAGAIIGGYGVKRTFDS